jgi:hypothetical protein
MLSGTELSFHHATLDPVLSKGKSKRGDEQLPAISSTGEVAATSTNPDYIDLTLQDDNDPVQISDLTTDPCRFARWLALTHSYLVRMLTSFRFQHVDQDPIARLARESSERAFS